MSNSPKVFISYSWTSEDYKATALKQDGDLVGKSEDVILDQWDLHAGRDRIAFMEQSIEKEDTQKVERVTATTYSVKSFRRKYEKEKNDISIRSSAAEYLTFVAATGESEESVEMRYEDENIWMTQKMMAVLYDVGVNTINYHIKKIFRDSELQPDSVIRKFRITATDGKPYLTNHYALQMVIAVGFKVNSERAVQFRKWVNEIATTFTIKGWVMDEERLKNSGSILTKKYFEEQLEKIREIRASERMFYQKITDLYATAIDYDRSALSTKRFFATVQNKMHYAVHGHTAAEVIVERADAEKPHMGLTTWADAPQGKIRPSDVVIARNYLSEFEMGQLNRMVSAYLDIAETMAERHIPMTMQDWETRLNGFIQMLEYGLLQDAGKVTTEIAKLHALAEFEKYRVVQDHLYMSDYDRFILELEGEKDDSEEEAK